MTEEERAIAVKIVIAYHDSICSVCRTRKKDRAKAQRRRKAGE